MGVLLVFFYDKCVCHNFNGQFEEGVPNRYCLVSSRPIWPLEGRGVAFSSDSSASVRLQTQMSLQMINGQER